MFCLFEGVGVSGSVENNSEIICSECHRMALSVFDDNQHYIYASQYIIKDAYFYNNNNYMKEANFQQNQDEYSLHFKCHEFTNDVFLTFKLSDNKETDVYVMTVKIS